MASKSRAAQEHLVELEKLSAPLGEQLEKAARFIGVELAAIATYIENKTEGKEKSNGSVYHGREEWLLRWLLKKLQGGDEVPRKTSASWQLLYYILRIIPTPVAARVLAERQFVTILRQTLEDIRKEVSNEALNKDMSTSKAVEQESSDKASRKRKRSGELAARPICQEPLDQMRAIFSVVDLLVQSANSTLLKPEEGRGSAFSAEYMKTVIRTTSKDAAIILGSWLSLCHSVLQAPQNLRSGDIKNWLSPFIELWDIHEADDNSLMQFSVNSTLPLLQLFRTSKASSVREFDGIDWATQLEQLISRNIMVPARASNMANAESDLLDLLTRVSILRDTANAPELFEIAIRSIQPHRSGSGRRRANDEKWLQTVFKTLKSVMPPQTADKNVDHICAMIQCAIDHKVQLDFSDLRSITAQYGLPEDRENWKLLATVLDLDENVFLIPDQENNLLEKLFERITSSSLESSWPQISVQIVSGILVPLMTKFARARDLPGFIRHWFAQLDKFEKLRKEKMLPSISHFSAWEDEAMQAELSKLLESSLTVQQIHDLTIWFSEHATDSPDASCVLLEAVAGSISHEDVVDAVGGQIYSGILNAAWDKLDVRYKWRFWALLSKACNWFTELDFDALATIWEENTNPFDSLLGETISGGLVEPGAGKKVGLDRLEIMRFACAAYTSAKEGSQMKSLSKPVVLDILQRLSHDIKRFPHDLKKGSDFDFELCHLKQNALHRGVRWTLWSYVQCLFVEYPKALGLGLELEGDTFKEMLQAIFWVASASSPELCTSVKWLVSNSTAFPDLWMYALQCDTVLDNDPLIEIIIDILTSSQSNTNNPVIESSAPNSFAVKSLLLVPSSILSKKHRERILKGWLPSPDETENEDTKGFSYESTVLDPEVLALKIRVLERPVIYEGISFREFIGLADALAEAEVPHQIVNLSLLAEMVHLTFKFMHTNLDQPPQKAYLTDAFRRIQKRVKKASGKKHLLNYALIKIFGTAFTVFDNKSLALDEMDIIPKHDLESVMDSYQDGLLTQLKTILRKSRKGETTTNNEYLSIIAITDALGSLIVDSSKLVDLKSDIKAFCALKHETEWSIGDRLEAFMAIKSPETSDEKLETHLRGDVSTILGRELIIAKARAITAKMATQEKLSFLSSILKDGLVEFSRLDILLALNEIIKSIDDTQKSMEHGEDNSSDGFSISAAYNILCGQLWKAASVRQFCVIAEILDMMLRTKGRSLSQFNIDHTLDRITIICSSKGPDLNPKRVGTIYNHLCHLMQAVLLHHRLKLQGHFHLVVQVIQTLLRCLFTPLPHSSKSAKSFGAPPPWLASPKHQLTSIHAESFTRLVTLICNPSVSSVRGAQHNELVSATNKAKHIAGQHMQHVLTTYIKLQLEMKMLPEIREKMVPGIYAVFDTTTEDGRRLISESMDASGRAIFVTLYRDYRKFGKWKGN